MAGVEIVSGTLFAADGSAHFKQYIDIRQKLFYAEHWFFQETAVPTTKVININYTEDDVLPLAQVSLLRSGPAKFDPNDLENNTYQKLNNRFYKGTMDNILADYFIEVVLPKYNVIREELSLPEMYVLTEFESLPESTRQMLATDYNIVPLEISEARPNCPRHILRNHYERKLVLQLMRRQQLMKYTETQDVHRFPYSSFYNEDRFIEELKKVADWANLQYNDYDSIKKLHSQFMKKQPYAFSKQKCDRVVQDVVNNTGTEPDALNLFEESYVNAQLVKLGHERRYRY